MFMDSHSTSTYTNRKMISSRLWCSTSSIGLCYRDWVCTLCIVSQDCIALELIVSVSHHWDFYDLVYLCEKEKERESVSVSVRKDKRG